MPELPEVETVCLQLRQKLKDQPRITGWIFRRPDLRFPIPQEPMKKLMDSPIDRIDRRAKYLLIYVKDQLIIWHLGMTGSFRFKVENEALKTHDHIGVLFENGLQLWYEDPRRFGFVHVIQQADKLSYFKSLGPEPFLNTADKKSINIKLKKINTPIKSALLNQKNIVGIGNIYASEILFKARVNPFKLCSKLSEKELNKIWAYTAKILKQAIAKGGSTIQSYKSVNGQSGRFQNSHQVYGRENSECRDCSKKIRQKFLSGRSTFWCPSCQK